MHILCIDANLNPLEYCCCLVVHKIRGLDFFLHNVHKLGSRVKKTGVQLLNRF